MRRSPSASVRRTLFAVLVLGVSLAALPARAGVESVGLWAGAVDVLNSESSAEVASFNCVLYSAAHRRQRHVAIDVGRERAAHTYTIPNGKELLGQKLWLRAEEIGVKGRILNYHVTAQP